MESHNQPWVSGAVHCLEGIVNKVVLSAALAKVNLSGELDEEDWAVGEGIPAAKAYVSATLRAAATVQSTTWHESMRAQKLTSMQHQGRRDRFCALQAVCSAARIQAQDRNAVQVLQITSCLAWLFLIAL